MMIAHINLQAEEIDETFLINKNYQFFLKKNNKDGIVESMDFYFN